MFLLGSVSRSALRPTQPPIQWLPGCPFPGVKRGWGTTLTTHSHVVPIARMSRSYTSLLIGSCMAVGHLYFIFYSNEYNPVYVIK
jgi:hypothetical protein